MAREADGECCSEPEDLRELDLPNGVDAADRCECIESDVVDRLICRCMSALVGDVEVARCGILLLPAESEGEEDRRRVTSGRDKDEVDASLV